MMYILENHRGFIVVMVIECSVASGEMEFGGGGGGWRKESRGRDGGGQGDWMGVSGRRGCYLNCFP